MAKIYGPQIKKLQNAINQKFDAKLVINKTQFYSDALNRPIDILVIKHAIFDDRRQKYRYEELFSSTSDVQIVLWLRDYWYELNKWEIPDDNVIWKAVKDKYKMKHQTPLITDASDSDV